MSSPDVSLKACQDPSCRFCKMEDIPNWIKPYIEYLVDVMDAAYQSRTKKQTSIKLPSKLLAEGNLPDWSDYEGM